MPSIRITYFASGAGQRNYFLIMYYVDKAYVHKLLLVVSLLSKFCHYLPLQALACPQVVCTLSDNKYKNS